jgi:hypothetical protein
VHCHIKELRLAGLVESMLQMRTAYKILYSVLKGREHLRNPEEDGIYY